MSRKNIYIYAKAIVIPELLNSKIQYSVPTTLERKNDTDLDGVVEINHSGIHFV
jgi:hypothetical protein